MGLGVTSFFPLSVDNIQYFINCFLLDISHAVNANIVQKFHELWFFHF